MKEVKRGQLVKSKAGRDKYKFFVIIDIESEYVYLVDGNIRRLENPKKKKRKHIQVTNIVASEIEDKIMNDKKLTNADIRKSLIAYQTDENQS